MSAASLRGTHMFLVTDTLPPQPSVKISDTELPRTPTYLLWWPLRKFKLTLSLLISPVSFYSARGGSRVAVGDHEHHPANNFML